jgi:choline-sulfatase
MIKEKPNILLLMTDQQRPDSLGCYGSEVARTPNLDWLAKNGVVFDNCYVQNPLCCPSRYSLLTGQYPHCHGVVSNWHAPRPGRRSFGYYLGKAGYQSAAIGKMHLTPWQDNFGFDGRIIAEAKFDDECPDDYDSFLRSHGHSRKIVYDKNEQYRRQCTAIDSRLPQELHIDSFVGKSACEYLNRVDGDTPFCCFASFLSPHNPYDPPEPYNKMFKGVKFPARNMTEGEVERKPKEAYDYINKILSKEWGKTTDKLSLEQLQLIKENYYALNTLVDDWIGKIIDILKKRNLYDDTIIIYTSDHGDLLGDHGLMYKQCFYEQSVKVPLIIHCPEKFKSNRVNDFVELMDLFSTICQMGQSQPDYDIQSKSLLPVLNRQKNYVHRPAVFSENYFGKMIRTGPWKMVRYIGKDYGELYNLNEDPDEQNNLWDDSDMVSLKLQLSEHLFQWLTKSQDVMYKPVRGWHFDRSDLEYIPKNGRAYPASHQPWHLNGFADLYESWKFNF